ncbi:MAG: hypothetical protein IIC01_03000 [Planctomycetes bacterium]|nr:hypothetical protein [Planctomycetota bacterium]
MKILILMPLLLGSTPPSNDQVTINARIEADRLEVGQEYEIVLDVRFKANHSASEAGMPAPILQIQVPPSVRLSGKVLSSHKELSRNEFLHAPFERLMKDAPTRVPFTLVHEPAPEDQFSLNVLAYVSNGKGTSFVRRRLTLPVRASATAKEADPNTSDWGVNERLLQLGDKAALFKLPRADGSTVSLDQYLGKKNVVVTTYRAFW